VFRFTLAPEVDCSQVIPTEDSQSAVIAIVQTVPVATLCPQDAAAIYDLHIAYRNSLEVSMDKDLSRDTANFSDLVNIAELSVRRVIAMAKQVC